MGPVVSVIELGIEGVASLVSSVPVVSTVAEIAVPVVSTAAEFAVPIATNVAEYQLTKACINRFEERTISPPKQNTYRPATAWNVTDNSNKNSYIPDGTKYQTYQSRPQSNYSITQRQTPAKPKPAPTQTSLKKTSNQFFQRQAQGNVRKLPTEAELLKLFKQIRIQKELAQRKAEAEYRQREDAIKKEKRRRDFQNAIAQRKNQMAYGVSQSQNPYTNYQCKYPNASQQRYYD